jgi:hypothetical protein
MFDYILLFTNMFRSLVVTFLSVSNEKNVINNTSDYIENMWKNI